MCDTNQVGPVPNVDFKLLKISCHEQTLNGYQGIRKHKSFVFSSAKTCMSFCWASQEATECKHSTWTFVVFFSSSLRDISKDNLKISWRITWQGTAWRCASLRPLLLQRQPITNDYHKAAGPGESPLTVAALEKFQENHNRWHEWYWTWMPFVISLVVRANNTQRSR